MLRKKECIWSASVMPLKHNQGTWLRKVCYPRGFEKADGSQAFLTHFFLISGSEGRRMHANKCDQEMWFRKTCYPRAFEKPSGSHVSLNHCFLISGSEWFRQEGHMWPASLMPTRTTKKSGSEKPVTQGGLKNPLGHTCF